MLDIGQSARTRRPFGRHQVLTEHAPARPEAWDRIGQRWQTFAKAWATACAQAKLPFRIPHNLRRTVVRKLERAGVPRSVAIKLTGHKTESVYRRHAIVNDANLRGDNAERDGSLS
jgi:integrase